MAKCKQCGEQHKNAIKKYHLHAKHGGKQNLCYDCYMKLTNQKLKITSDETYVIHCSSCNTPIFSPTDQCPVCHKPLHAEKHKSYQETELREQHMKPWNNHEHTKKEPEDEMDPITIFSLRKPMTIVLLSIALILFISFSIIYVPAMVHTDADLFYGNWDGLSGVVKDTEWEFNNDNTLEIEISRPNTRYSKEYYHWEISDSHMIICNLDEDDKHFTDKNDSSITFLRYNMPLTYTFTPDKESFVFGTDRSKLAEPFEKSALQI